MYPELHCIVLQCNDGVQSTLGILDLLQFSDVFRLVSTEHNVWQYANANCHVQYWSLISRIFYSTPLMVKL